VIRWINRITLGMFAIWALGSGVYSATGLTGLDEYWHSMRTALQSLELNQWLIPVLDGEPRIEKPPLLYWLMMTSFAVLGVDFWTARLPSLALGLAFAVLLATLYADLFKRDRLAPFLIALSLLTVAVESRRAMLDLPVAVCTLAALIALVRQVRAPTTSWWIIGALAATAGFYFKGPVTLWFVLAGAIAFIANVKQVKAARVAPKLIACTVLTVGLCGLWPFIVSVYEPNWAERLAGDISDRNLTLPTLRNVIAVLSGLMVVSLPWSFVAFSTRPDAGRDNSERQMLRALWIWLLIAIIPFLFIRTFERYLLPMAIPLALLTTFALHGGISSLRAKLVSAVLLNAIPVLLFAAVAIWFFPPATVPAIAAMIALLLAASAAWYRVKIVTIVSLIAATSLTLGHLYPRFDINRLPNEIVADFSDGNSAHYASPYPGTLSMRVGKSVPIIERNDITGLQQHADKLGRLVLRAEDLPDLRSATEAVDATLTVEKRFRMFYSRGSFISLGKPGSTRDEWLRAIRVRDLSLMQPEFVTVRLARKEAI
jgi:4-amino-4-deoxy-L-arabinose transferase-like glycosyltransferase